MSCNTCANCGKEGSNVTNTCNKCKGGVMYCNAACKKKHRHKHKKQCERRVAEMHDELLFKQPPPLDDCPICFLQMPYNESAQAYYACCGKVICCGCIHAANVRDKKRAGLCPFCRTPYPATDGVVQRNKKRMEVDDPVAISSLGGFYSNGLNGLPQNMVKALELWHRAAELGHPNACYNIGHAYDQGIGVEVDKEKVKYYFELAAMRGEVIARNNLGAMEKRAGNLDRALKHFMIAIKGGYKKSLENIKQLYIQRHATKDDYTNALRAYQAYLDDVRSVQRDEAAAFKSNWKYYE